MVRQNRHFKRLAAKLLFLNELAADRYLGVGLFLSIYPL
jgi:hypothetical protein